MKTKKLLSLLITLAMVVSMVATLGTTASAAEIVTLKGSTPSNECYLDLDSTTADVLEKKELDQNYNLTVTTMPSRSGAVTKVKLGWKINDINAVRMENKVWDTTELKWVVASSNTTVMDNGTAEFKLENYSTVKVRATASFKAEKGFEPTVTYSCKNGRITLDTANGNDDYSKTNVPSGTINVTVKPGDDDFKTLAATASATKYGTYTVTLSENISEYKSYAANIANAEAPSTFVADSTAKTVTIKDEKAFLYYGLKWNAADAYNWTAKLDADIDLDDLIIANGFNCYAQFDGQNHTIKNLTVNGDADGTAGFFKTLNIPGDEGFVSVNNLVLNNITVKGECTNDGSYGILAGFSNCKLIKNVTVMNCSVTGGKYTGGIVGRTYTDVIGCTVKDTIISGQYKCGALVGLVAEGDGRNVKDNTLTNVTINCANLLSDKDHYETGKVIGNWNAATGTYSGNTVTNVAIVNGSAGYTDNEIGAIEEGCIVTGYSD